MNIEHRTSNIERRINVFCLFRKRLSEATSTIGQPSFQFQKRDSGFVKVSRSKATLNGEPGTCKRIRDKVEGLEGVGGAGMVME